jgi:hypothetical protein
VSCVFSKRVVDGSWRNVRWRLDCFRAHQVFQKKANAQSPEENNPRIIYDHNHHALLRRMRLRRNSLRIHRRTGDDAALSLSRLPSSGGPFSSFVIVPAEAFKLLQGSLRFHASPSEAGGKTHRGYCPECASPIQAKSDSVPHIVAIRSASLDDPSWFNPQVDVWTSDAHPWDQMNPALPKFEKYPPQTE